MSATSSDRNLLFGLLALQMDLVTREQLLDGMNAWLLRKGDPLGQVLAERGALTPAEREAVERLLEAHVARHGGDARRSLAAVRAGPAVREGLSRLGDTDLRASAASLSTPAGAAGVAPAVAPGAGAMRYRKLRPHARGGLGEVSVALDEELNREVALKEVQARHAHRADLRARFVREAEVTGHLEHPGVVPVYGLGAHPDGQPYYAMRLIRGESLQEAVTRFHRADEGRRDPSERELALRSLLGRFVAVCYAVAYAHSRGVVHRDLKPANVMLGEYGETLVVDWGLARVVGQPEEATAAERPLLLAGGPPATEVGQVVGTPAYMPPEQARGELDRVDQRSDVFALGATLYALLTGRPPYERDGVSLLAAAAACDHPPARGANPRVPAALGAVCARAMAARPEGRYASARALAADVERWLADEPVEAMPEPLREKARRWARRNRTLVASGVVLVLASVAGLGVGLAAVRAEQLRTAEQRDRAEEAEGVATARLAEVERALARAERAEGEARANLRQSEANFRLARQVVDDCFGVAKDHPLLKGPLLSPELHKLKRLLLEKALPFYQQFRAARPADRGVQSELWDQHFRVGIIQDELGSKPEALKSYRQAEQVGRALVKASPGDATYQNKLARTLVHRGLVQKALGEQMEARLSHHEGGEFLRALVKARPGVLAYRHDLAKALNCLGIVQLDLGEPKEARQSYQEAIETLQGLLETQPGTLAYQESLASALINLSRLQQGQGERSEARRSCQEAIRLFRALSKADPESPTNQSALAKALNNLGSIQNTPGGWAEARQSYQESIRLHRALVKAQPGVPEHQSNLSLALNNLATVQDDLGERVEARQSYQESIQLRRALILAQPGVPHHQDALAGGLYNLGLLHNALGERAEARQCYQEAIRLRRALVHAQPGVPRVRFDFCNPLLSFAAFLRGLGQPEEARRHLDEALHSLDWLKQRHPDHPGVTFLRFVAHRRRAGALAEAGRLRAALADWDRALALAPLNQRSAVRVEQALALAGAGEHAGAATEAEAIVRQRPLATAVAYDAACVFALSAAGAHRDAHLPLPLRERQTEARARQAVGLLHSLARAGFFRDAARRAHLGNDPDLASLRDRPDFRAFVAALPPPAK